MIVVFQVISDKGLQLKLQDKFNEMVWVLQSASRTIYYCMHKCKLTLYFPAVEMGGWSTDSPIHDRIHIWKDELHWIRRRTLLPWNLCSVAGPSHLSRTGTSEVSRLCGMRKELWYCAPQHWPIDLFQGFKILLFFNDINHILMGSTGLSLNFVVATESIILYSVELTACNSNSKSQS